MINLYSWGTPNGRKITIMLEELELDYILHPINITGDDQFEAEFLAISPNNKIPAIIDSDNGQTLFESGAIMMYLAEKTGKLMPDKPKARWATIEWLMFQMGGVGPMMGQANIFFRYFPEKIPAAIDRYQNECRRLFEVLDLQLSKHQWLAGEYSIADIANWCWVRTHNWSGVSIEGLDNLDRWKNEMYNKPGMKEGIKVPVSVENLLKDKKKAANFIKNTAKIVKK